MDSDAPIEVLRQGAFKSLQCLYIAVEESVANDVNAKLKGYIQALEKRTSIDLVLDLLNSILAADPKALSALARIRIPCNLALADHPDVVVQEVVDAPETYEVGVIGIFNALVSRVTGERVAFVLNDEHPVEVTGFKRYDVQKQKIIEEPKEEA